MSSEWKQKVAQSFDKRADQYDFYNAIQNEVAESLVGDLPAYVAPEILEIGCGTGALTQHLLETYKDGHFYITDISPKMVDRARARFGQTDNIEWGVMDGETPDQTRRYDLIVSNMAFQWFSDLKNSLERLQGLLKPNGTLLYSIPAADGFKEWHTILEELSLQSGTLEYKKPAGIFREEEKAVQYESTFDFLQSMKKLGAHTPRDGYERLSRSDILKACKRADEQFHGQITWRILYGRLL